MPSRIDVTHPRTGIAVSKAESRANNEAAKAEIEHAGFFRQDSVAAVERTGQDKLSDVASVKDFGAVGDGVVDDTAAIQEALNTGYVIFVPPGRYRVTAGITIPDRGGLTGSSSSRSVIFADNVNGPALSFNINNERSNEGQILEKIRVEGTCETVVQCSHTRFARIRDVAVRATCIDAFRISWVWGCSFVDLDCNNAFIDQDRGAAVRIGEAYNANYLANVYCGGQGRAFYGIVIEENGHGNLMNMLTLQGCRYGLFVRKMANHGGLTVHGIYTENTVTPVRLGGRSKPNALVRGVMISGGSLSGPWRDHPHYDKRTACIELMFAWGVSLSAISFEAVWGDSPTLQAILYDRCGDVDIAGCYLPKDGLGTSITDYIQRTEKAHRSSGFFIRQTNQDDRLVSELVMKAEETDHGHYRMRISKNGNWVSKEWLPTEFSPRE